MNKQSGFTSPELLVFVWVLVLIAGSIGWVWNIVKLVGMDFHLTTGMLVVRAVGIVFAPLGAIVGYL